MLRNAIFANLLIKNQKKTCEERGIPPAIFKDAWDEYQHTAQYQGRFFHRLELAAIPSASVKIGCTKMVEALAAHRMDGTQPIATIQRFGVSKSSFYHAIKWEKDNPGKKWGCEVIRSRGKTTLLTPDMEAELHHWIALSQRYNGGVDRDTCCRVAYSLMASDPEHFARVKVHHKEFDGPRRMLSRAWFFKLKNRIPNVLSRHKVQAYAVGRAMVTRSMVDSVYDVLQVVLTAAQDVIPAANIWNMDETGTKTQYAKTFLYGLKGAHANQAEQCGLGEHVTIGVTANLEGKFLDPTFLFTGALSSQAGMTTRIKNAGFENPLVLLKRGKASMDAKLFGEYMEWFAAELARQGLKGQHILFLDNHDSHERATAISAAMKNGILLITFPSHCTHVLQMLDISFFKALKSQYKAAAKLWLEEGSHAVHGKPYLNKQVFIELFRTAWVGSTKPENAINGWKAMGLQACKETGMVCINRNAIKEYKLASSDKYTPLVQAGVQQAVRICTGTGDDGTNIFKDYDFNFTQEGLENIRIRNPELYAMHIASKTYLMQQEGMPMHQRGVKPCAIEQPLARVLTTKAMLNVAIQKDIVSLARTTKMKRNVIAKIGKELGSTVFVDGTDVVAELNMKGQRCHYCPHCKQTLVRPCAKAKCKRLASGEAVLPKPRRQKRVAAKERAAKSQVAKTAVARGHGKEVSETEPWVSDLEGLLAVGQKFRLAFLTDDLLDNGITATVTAPLLWPCEDGQQYNMLEFTYAMEEGGDDSDMSQVREVYEAIQATKRISLKL